MVEPKTGFSAWLNETEKTITIEEKKTEFAATDKNMKGIFAAYGFENTEQAVAELIGNDEAKEIKSRLEALKNKKIEKYYKSLGSINSPLTAHAAAVIGDARYTSESNEPSLPLKFLFEVATPTSPGPNIP